MNSREAKCTVKQFCTDWLVCPHMIHFPLNDNDLKGKFINSKELLESIL